ncbi:glycerol kinase GlpK [Phragmitibacter flavus]|uniref:Glycerol kinase n=1 Tax=Phragmitibacter flavus TaxID=2576071 RepID=A0A5R8KF83_9BACT|nr:glycerol kinase GlpK [Phragmitibacter flavus]TLD70269.1 glycerol kinase GlpK [Phragmitibacter flavus]
MKFILALDQGTTSSRAIVFAHDGSIIASAQQEFTQIFPQAGWVEHNAKEIWDSQLTTAREALEKAKLKAADIAAIGITNQRETAVIWDRKTGEPIGNAIVWQDRRTSKFCDELKAAGHGEIIQQRNGLVIDAYFAGSKVRWMLDNIPGARDRANNGELAFGTIDSWLIWNLTNGKEHLTDVTNASRTMFYNLHENAWDDDLLKILDIPRQLLPEIRSSSEVYAETAEGLFDAPIKIAGIGGDQQAALFGQNCFKRGMAKNTYGTGCFMLMNIGDQPSMSKHKLLTTVAWQRNGKTDYALEGSIFIGGAVVQWLRDGLGIIESSNEIEALAASVEDCGGVYLVPAFAGLGAPHWDQYARGTITGLTRGTTKGHIARAALEGIAFQVADILEVMKQDSGIDMKELRVDGGACANNLLMQFQADILQTPVVRPKIIETTAMGAAYLAGLAVGFWNTDADVEKAWQVDRIFEPQMPPEEAAHRRERWDEALKRAGDWEEHSTLKGKAVP